jgi:hypothetical protein
LRNILVGDLLLQHHHVLLDLLQLNQLLGLVYFLHSLVRLRKHHFVLVVLALLEDLLGGSQTRNGIVGHPRLLDLGHCIGFDAVDVRARVPLVVQLAIVADQLLHEVQADVAIILAWSEGGRVFVVDFLGQ